MTSLEQIQQDLKILPPEALNLVYQFIQILKKGSQVSRSPQARPSSASDDAVDWSDFIGAASAEEDLSVNYKAYLAKELEKKYDHR
jgi:hypothetical protein